MCFFQQMAAVVVSFFFSSKHSLSAIGFTFSWYQSSKQALRYFRWTLIKSEFLRRDYISHSAHSISTLHKMILSFHIFRELLEARAQG